MKLILFGGTGDIGSQLLMDALDRNHWVTASVLDLTMVSGLRHERLILVQGDVTDQHTVARQASGHNAVISAVGGWREYNNNLCELAAHSLVAGLRMTDVRRLIIVGAAGTLEVAPGIQRMDSPGFPKELLDPAQDQRAALNYLREFANDLDWTYFSPPALIEHGERKGTYRFGTDELIMDDSGNSRISVADYSSALLDELENPKYLKGRFTIAY